VLELLIAYVFVCFALSFGVGAFGVLYVLFKK
jgi:hypothetical protein